jgi:glycosyltransferase involved in cell wall biosynthesis
VRFLAGITPIGRVRELRRLIADERPHLVHTTLFESSVAGRLAAVGKPVRIMSSLVNTPYDPVRLQDPKIRAGRMRLVRLFDSWTARLLTSHFHAITGAVKDAAVATLGIPADRITVIERGRDPDRLGQPSRERRRRARQSLGLEEDDEVLVNVGRQEYQKGQRYLLEAVPRLLANHPRLVLLIAGRDGHATAELQRTHRELELGGRVRFLGHRSDVPDILAAADVFVFPSLFEGLGGSVIEAMALGLPVVASDIPALREVVADGANARLVSPGSSRALAQAIAGLLDDENQRRGFGERSRAIFEERFTLERSTSRMIALYERLTATSGLVATPRS